MTQAALARESGVDEATISATVNRDSKTSQFAIQLATALRVSLAWLLTGAGSMDDEAGMLAAAKSPYVMIPKYDAGAGMGSGVFNEGHVDIDGSYPLRRDRIERMGWRAEALRVMWTRGNSMAPNIKDGDPVVVNTDLTAFVDGQVFAIEDPGEGARIKRLHKMLDGRIRVSSDNPDKRLFPDDYITPDMNLRIIGQVVDRSGSP